MVKLKPGLMLGESRPLQPSAGRVQGLDPRLQAGLGALSIRVIAYVVTRVVSGVEKAAAISRQPLLVSRAPVFALCGAVAPWTPLQDTEGGRGAPPTSPRTCLTDRAQVVIWTCLGSQTQPWGGLASP